VQIYKLLLFLSNIFDIFVVKGRKYVYFVLFHGVFLYILLFQANVLVVLT